MLRLPDSIDPGQIFDSALFHLPYGADTIFKSIHTNRALLVVMEILSQHPIKITSEDISRIDYAFYLHKE